MSFSSPSLPARVYYCVKPLVPRRVRWVLRRRLARRILSQCSETWPIDEAAGEVPDGWPGWPEQKRFAVVLTHDVESSIGLKQVRPLAELEMELGFRSSFNFIPEGEYSVPDELRHWLVDNGFEVGIHDLHHDGNLYSSRGGFRRKAIRINRYLREWDACGFRSGFMLRRLPWLRDLDILYDGSTFDTDPFEPQPDGAGTIFPFRIPDSRTAGGTGYIELPYTLPQDSTLFLLLGEETSTIWSQKTAWLAKKGGLVLVNVHPDYIDFGDGVADGHCYALDLYRDWLRELRDKYDGAYWHGLPKELAAFADRDLPTSPATPPKPEEGGELAKIWIDLDNTPHVPFFEPIIKELQARGFPVVVTARDAFQVCELAEQKGLECTLVGRHNGRHLVRKAAGLLGRSLRLMPFAMREAPAIAVSHGSRAQLLSCRFMDIPTLELTDYEHAQSGGILKPTWLMGPESLAESDLARRSDHFRSYPGLKEDVYVGRLAVDDALPEALGLQTSDIVVTVRPPATEAHYHDPAGERLFECFMKRATQTPNVKIVLLPRNRGQEDDLRKRFSEWFDEEKTIIPDTALDGLQLIWHSDLVVGGGGTMNREAAALGVPVYSIFRGKTGAVDQQLASEGRLVLIESEEDVTTRIPLRKRQRSGAPPKGAQPALDTIVDAIIDFAGFRS